MKSEQVTVHLEPAMYAPIRRQAEDWESSESAVVRRIIKHWASNTVTVPEEPFDPGEWREEEVTFSIWHGPYVRTMRRAGHNRRAHRITYLASRLWVLPDDRTSGQLRSRTIRDALAAVDGTGLDPLSYVAGCLLRVDATRLYWQEEE